VKINGRLVEQATMKMTGFYEPQGARVNYIHLGIEQQLRGQDCLNGKAPWSTFNI
jgi:hypothetical protein